MDILTTDYYDDVRRSVHPSFTESDLAAAVIEAIPFGPSAEREVKRQAPDWAVDVDDPDLAPMLLAAVVALTASRIVARNVFPISTWLGDVRVQMHDAKPEALAALLRAEADSELIAYVEAKGAPPVTDGPRYPPPFLFGVADGGRGRML